MTVAQGLTRKEKIAKARELRAAGLTYVEIGNRLGITRSCASKWCNPDRTREWNRSSNAGRNAYKRSIAKTSGAAPCEDCGAKMGEGSLWRRNRRCRSCETARQNELRDQRRAEIEALFNEGLTNKEIAEAIGSTANAVGSEISYMRRGGGYDLPYRRRESMPRFPDQVAA